MIKDLVPLFIATKVIKSYSQEVINSTSSLLETKDFKFHKNIKNFTLKHINKSYLPFKINDKNKFGTSFGINSTVGSFFSKTYLNIKFGKRDTKNNNLFAREFY